MYSNRLILYSALCAILSAASGRLINFNDDYKVEVDILGDGENTTISLTFTINTKGYIGFGVGLNANMTDSDLFIGGVNSTSRELYGKDYFARRNEMPTEDSIQNWKVIWGNETGNVTMLKAERLIDTKDDRHDYEIRNATMYVLWSYGEFDVLVHHYRRGVRLLNLFTVDDSPFTTTTLNPISSTSGPTSTTVNSSSSTSSPTTMNPSSSTLSQNSTTSNPSSSTTNSTTTTTTLNPSSTTTTLNSSSSTSTPTTTTTIPSTSVKLPTSRLLILNANYSLDISIFESGSNSTLQLLFRVNTIGYVGFGLSRSPNMTGADLFIGGFNETDNRIYGKDYHARGNTMPVEDSVNGQDWKVLSGNEKDGITTLHVERNLNTNDTAEDIAITNSDIYVIWAYGETDLVGYHRGTRGARKVNLFTVDDSLSTTTSNPSSESPGSGATSVTLSATVFLLAVTTFVLRK